MHCTSCIMPEYSQRLIRFDILTYILTYINPNLHKGERGGAFVTKRVSDVTLSCVNILRLSVVFIIASGYIYPSSRSQAEILASQMFIESTCICQQAQLCLQTHLLSMMCVLNFCDLRSMQCHITSHTRSRSSPSFEKVGKIQNTTLPA